MTWQLLLAMKACLPQATPCARPMPYPALPASNLLPRPIEASNIWVSENWRAPYPISIPAAMLRVARRRRVESLALSASAVPSQCFPLVVGFRYPKGSDLPLELGVLVKCKVSCTASNFLEAGGF